MIQKNILKSKLSLKEKTQKDLAKVLGLSKVSVSKKVNGLSRFSLPEGTNWWRSSRNLYKRIGTKLKFELSWNFSRAD